MVFGVRHCDEQVAGMPAAGESQSAQDGESGNQDEILRDNHEGSGCGKQSSAEGDGMSTKRGISPIAVLGVFLMMGADMSANAGLFGLGGTSWKEEVLLHDGTKIVVERWHKRGGRHEITAGPPVKEQSITFVIPGTDKAITWRDEYGEDVGSANFEPIAMDILSGIPYIVATAYGCLSYNKWGRPNPPYIVFRHNGMAWQRIPMAELPTSITNVNLVVDTSNNEKKLAGLGRVAVEEIRKLNSSLRQPEYKTILREPVKIGSEGSAVNCEELVYYKGAWVGPGDSIGKRMMDRKIK